MKSLNSWRHRTDMKIGASFGVKGSNKAADRGIRYHRKVFRALEANPPLPGFQLLVEPWLAERTTGRHCQPDSVFLDLEARLGVVVEVKLNWKDGRDEKLHDLYLPAVKSCWDLDLVWPLLITQDLRGYRHPPLLGLPAAVEAMAWEPGQPTPLLLLP